MKNSLVKTMKSENALDKEGIDPELFDFAARFLQFHGAALEKEEADIEALIPDHLRALLNVPEHIRISGDSTGEEENANQYMLTYGAPILEQMIATAMQSIPLLGCRLEFDYVKNGGFQRLMDEQLTLYKAVASVESAADVKTEYAILTCRYIAQSDEQKEGLLSVAFNMETGAFVPAMVEQLDNCTGRIVFKNPEKIEPCSLSSIESNIEKNTRKLLEERLEPFRHSMNRRFKRDIKNMAEYYKSLETEMRNSLNNPVLSENGRADRQAKIDALPAELASKIDDLFKKYSIKIRLKPNAIMRIQTPAKKIVSKLSVGRWSRQFFLTYNPVTRAIDPPACHQCDKPITHIHFNADLEPVCFDCR